MGRILSVQDRIRLFKELNKVHKAMYGWKLIYDNAWHAGKIDIENDIRLGLDEPVPISKSDAGRYYFLDDKGNDIPSFKGIFEWQANYLYHIDPYNFYDFGKNRPSDEDLITNNFGKRIRSDVNHPVDCLETMIGVQQRKDDEKIWISSNWLYHPDCYGSGEGFGTEIYRTFSEVARGDEKVAEEFWAKYENIVNGDSSSFEMSLKRYFRGGRLDVNYWDGGYLFAASKERRIKTLEQLNEAMDEEDGHFRSSLEEFIRWFRSNRLNLGEKVEEGLRRRMREYYSAYPCSIAKGWCKLLVEEDKVEPSDVYLWWGGEPNSDSCYAFLTLYFEVDPKDIGTPSFDERVSRNLRTIINIAKKDHGILSSYREFEPKVWNAIFS